MNESDGFLPLTTKQTHGFPTFSKSPWPLRAHLSPVARRPGDPASGMSWLCTSQGDANGPSKIRDRMRCHPPASSAGGSQTSEGKSVAQFTANDPLQYTWPVRYQTFEIKAGHCFARFLPTNLAGGILGRHALVNMNFLFLKLTLKPKAAQGLSWLLVSDSVVTKHVFLMDQLAWRAATCLSKLNAFITNYAIVLALALVSNHDSGREPFYYACHHSWAMNQTCVVDHALVRNHAAGMPHALVTSRAVVMSLTRVMGRTLHNFVKAHIKLSVSKLKVRCVAACLQSAASFIWKPSRRSLVIKSNTLAQQMHKFWKGREYPKKSTTNLTEWQQVDATLRARPRLCIFAVLFRWVLM